MFLRAGFVSIALPPKVSSPASQGSAPSPVPSIPFEVHVYLSEVRIKSFEDAGDIAVLSNVDVCAGPSTIKKYKDPEHPQHGILLQKDDGSAKDSHPEIRSTPTHGTTSSTRSRSLSSLVTYRLKCDKITLFPSKTLNAHVFCQHVDASILAYDNSLLLVKTHSYLALRVQDNAATWMEATIDAIDATLRENDGGSFMVHSFCIQRTVLASSEVLGKILTTIPTVTFSGTDIAVDGKIAISMQSRAAVQPIQQFVARILPRDDQGVGPVLYGWQPPLGVPITVQEVSLLIDDASAANVRMVGVAIGENVGYSSSIVYRDAFESAGSVSDVTVAGGSEINIQLGQVDSVHVASAFSLTSPTKGATLVLAGGALFLRAGFVSVALPPNVSSCANQGSAPSLVPSIPFQVRVYVSEAHIKSSVGSADSTVLSEVDLSAGPFAPDVFAEPTTPQSGTLLRANVGKVKNCLMEVSTIRASGVCSDNAQSFQNFWLSIANAKLVAGFTNLDWSGIIKGGHNEGHEGQARSPKVDMPYARVDAMHVTVSLKGNVVGSSTSVNVPVFVGDSKTSMTEILDHLIGSITKKVPSFILNVEIMGESIVDRTAKGVGLMTMSSSMSGAAVGSVSGLVVVDGIRGAIRSGKKARGADKDDGYRFGDFTRGSIRAVGNAMVTGAERRRGDSSRYEVGDLTTGVASSAGQYVGENKARLGSAAASGVGMTIGLAVAGPIGLVAGSYLGAKAGGHALKESGQGGDAKKIASINSAIDNATTDLHSDSDADLLGLHEADLCESNRVSHDYIPIHGPPSGLFNSVTLPFDSRPAAPRPQASDSTMSAALLFSDATPTTQIEPCQLNSFAGQKNQEVGSVLQFSCSDSSAHRTIIQRHAGNPRQQNVCESHLVYHGVSQSSEATASRQQAVSSMAPPQHLDHSNDRQSQGGYRFGDLTRSVIDAGKAKDGRKATDGYKFGDFTRGLFSS